MRSSSSSTARFVALKVPGTPRPGRPRAAGIGARRQLAECLQWVESGHRGRTRSALRSKRLTLLIVARVFDAQPFNFVLGLFLRPNQIIARLRPKLAQIQGASGFQHLREDLNDRVRVRSGGKVRDLVIQSLIIE